MVKSNIKKKKNHFPSKFQPIMYFFFSFFLLVLSSLSSINKYSIAGEENVKVEEPKAAEPTEVSILIQKTRNLNSTQVRLSFF